MGWVVWSVTAVEWWHISSTDFLRIKQVLTPNQRQMKVPLFCYQSQKSIEEQAWREINPGSTIFNVFVPSQKPKTSYKHDKN